jgi:hypothetical protein
MPKPDAFTRTIRADTSPLLIQIIKHATVSMPINPLNLISTLKKRFRFSSRDFYRRQSMDTSAHTMTCLFDQLGLDSSDAAIQSFVAAHQLPAETKITEATFWSDGQRQFLKESYKNDADWIPIVDDLNAQLHDD